MSLGTRSLLGLIILATIPLLTACEATESPCTGQPNFCDDSNTWHFCPEGADKWATQACGDDALCREDGCKPIVCTIGQTACSEDATALRTCAESGAAWRETPCTNSGICVDGKCRSRACDPDTQRCSEDHRRVLGCPSPGLAWQTLQTCPTDHACHLASCEPVVCHGGASRCPTDRRVEHCRASGTGWDATDCPETQICAHDQCRSVICTPGTLRCTTNFRTVEACDETGTLWQAVETCADGDACAPEGCRPRVCTPGQWDCSQDHAIRQRCTASGTGWELPSPCGDTQACRDGTCHPRLCPPGLPFCSADAMTLQDCDATGTLVLSSTRCPETDACQGGRCVPATSPVGEVVLLDAAQGTVTLTPGYYAAAVFDLSQAEGSITFPLVLSGDVQSPKSVPLAAMQADGPPVRPLPHTPPLPIPPFDNPMAGRDATPPIRQAPIALAVGDRRYFHIDNGGWRLLELEAELRHQGSHCNIWEDLKAATYGTRMSDATVARMAELLDAGVAGRVIDLFGQPTDVDGNGRIDLFFTPYLPNDSAAAFVWPVTFFPPGTWTQPYDHGEIVYTMAPSAYYPVEQVVSILAHEMTHLVAIGRRLAPWLDRPDQMPYCRMDSEAYVEEGLAETGAAHSGLVLLESAQTALRNPARWRLGAFTRTNYYDDWDANSAHYGLGAVLMGFLMQQAGGVQVTAADDIVNLGGADFLDSVITGPCGLERLSLPGPAATTFPDWFRDFMGAMLLTTLATPGTLGQATVPDRYAYAPAQADAWFGGWHGIPLYRSSQQGILRRTTWANRPNYLARGGASFVSVIVGDGGATVRMDTPTSEALLVRYLP